MLSPGMGKLNKQIVFFAAEHLDLSKALKQAFDDVTCGTSPGVNGGLAIK